ncbi:MAG: hypothetical protein QME07_05370 [bacterium]|nr:hypothetical protein [bacterium]
MGKRILLGVGLLVVCWLSRAEAASPIINTADLTYSDQFSGTYTGFGSCTLIKIIVNVSIKKQARNITRGGTYTDIAIGQAGDMVEYRIILENTGSDETGTVTVADSLPPGIVFQPDSYGTGTGIKVDGVAQTNVKDVDKANYESGKITVGKNEAGDNGNQGVISIPGSGKVNILYQVKIE